jgi:hypothetical protein
LCCMKIYRLEMLGIILKRKSKFFEKKNIWKNRKG